MEKIKSKKANNFFNKALLGTILIFFGSLFLLWIIGVVMNLLYRGPMRMLLLSDLFIIRIILSILVIVFSLILIFTYLKDYFELKNELTAGLVLAMISLMLFGLSTSPFCFMLIPFLNQWIIQTLSMFFTIISLAILLWISYK
ncbi:MAG: hypothetical protein ACK4J0_03830 [Candidatus Anstonellaceae archaeon]